MREYYNEDCMQGMKRYPDNFFDLAIVDPPYGVDIGGQINKGTRKTHIAFGRGGGVCDGKAYKAFDDTTTPSGDYFKELKRASKHQIIWGGNYFLDYLGATKCLIIWDKGRRGIHYADCEVAWTNIDDACRIYAYLWDGMRQEDMKNKEFRIHPTQKPVALYTWILTNYAKPGDKILDTHVGSASSLIACEEMGFDYVGFELDEDYYKQSKERLDRHNAQISLMELI